MRIGIIGSGKVGTTSAFAIAERGSGHVLVYGRTAGQAVGKALDLAEAAPIRRYDVRIDGTNDLADLWGSDILVLASGRPRTADMSRFDLFDDNLPLVRDLGRRIRQGYGGQEPPVVIVLTEPVDLMTMAVLRETGLPRSRVMGVAGLLSCSRLRYFVSRALGISAADVDATVVGTHGERMVILERYCRVSGLPLDLLLTRDQIEEAFSRTVEAGTEVVRLARAGSSFYTPGVAVAALVQAIASDSNRVFCVSAALEGEYGVRGRCASVPTRIGAGGVEAIYELALTADEKEALHRSVAFQDPYAGRLEA